jgi:GT2 family glycosyltransferase/glycosyltransferase involved in cell wall biosynthesis
MLGGIVMPVAIAGMHRSGTSMIARMLNLCGLYLGDQKDLMPAAIDNSEGFWENIYFVEINEKILSGLKGGWDAPPVGELDWEISELNLHRKNAAHLVNNMNRHTIWGWKDPRNSLTFPFWQQLIPDLKVVACVRNPYEVALSLSRRGSSSHIFSMRLWYEYNKQLLNSVPQQNLIITHYDSFFYDGKAELRRLLSFLNMSVEDDTVEAACEEVHLTQKHNRAPLADLSSFDIYPEIGLMYSSMCAQAGPIYQLTLQANSDEKNNVQFQSTADEKPNGTELVAEKIMQDLRTQVVRNAYTIQSLNSSLEEIYSSTGWRLVLWLRKIHARLIPRGSFRGKVVGKIFAGLRKIKSFYRERIPRFMQRIKSAGIFRILKERFTSWSIARLEKKISLIYNHPVLAAPTVSIIVPVHNQIELTLNCLLSIAASQDQTDSEVIVMDDASTDETPRLLKDIEGIRYIQNISNQGFLVSCNEAVKRANGKYLVLLNNDTRVHQHWLDSMLETFSQFPKVGLVGSKLIFPNRKLQEAGGIIWADGTAKNYGRNDDPQNYIYNYLRPADYVSGASIMLPRTLWESLGGFDLQYQPAYYEDVDLAFKIRRAGYKVLYQPFSEVTHMEGSSSGVDLTTGAKQYQVVNHKKFYKTWRSTIGSYGLPAETPDYIQRDRSIKAQVLYIDDGTLKPDRNAGAVLSVSYITALRDNGYAVTFLPHFDLRYGKDYTRSLQKKGVECVYSPYVQSSTKYIEREGARFDYVVISRASVASELIDHVKKFAPQAKIIFNTIDLHHMRLDRAAKLSTKKDDLEIARKIKEIELNIIQKADCTLVVSNVEAKLLSDLLPDAMVRTVPFPADVFDPENGYDERGDIVYLGGFIHTPNVDAVLYFVNEVWPLISQKLPGARFVIAGPDAPEKIKSLASDTIIVKGFVEDLGSLFKTAKLSVAPIRYGAGIKGKVLTSLGYGVPCVATSIATEGIGLTNEENILIADTPAAFAEAVIRVFTTPENWDLLSRNSLNFIRQNYSRSVISSRLLDVFKELEELTQDGSKPQPIPSPFIIHQV